MSLNKYDSSTGELINIASGSRTWVGTRAAYDAAKQAGTLPTNALICITDDDEGLAQEVTEDDPRAVTSGAVYNALSNNKSIKYVRVFSGQQPFDASPLKIVSNSDASKNLYCSGILLLIDDWLYFNGCVGTVNTSGSLYDSTCSISSADPALSNLQWDPDWVDSLPTQYGDITGCGYLIWGGPVDTFTPVKGTLNLTTTTFASKYTTSTTKVYFCGKVKNINT